MINARYIFLPFHIMYGGRLKNGFASNSHAGIQTIKRATAEPAYAAGGKLILMGGLIGVICTIHVVAALMTGHLYWIVRPGPEPGTDDKRESKQYRDASRIS